jgi:processive 1,2-diacylglycerol beta-glucosyltransferase
MIADCGLRTADCSGAVRAESSVHVATSAVSDASPRRVLVLTLSFGAGHVRAARVVADALAKETDADVRVIDALKEARRLFKLFYAAPYWLMIRHAPRAWEWFFNQRAQSKAANTAPVWALRWGFKRTFEAIKNFQPDVIVACEVAACEIAALAKQTGITRARLVDVITDYESEPIWVKPEVDFYAVADERVREELCGWGAPLERVTVCGIPVDARFETESSADEMQTARARFGIETDAPVVLLMGGGMGPTRMDRVAAQLIEQRDVEINIIAVAGDDRKVFRRLQRLRASSAKNKTRAALRVVGWTDEIPSLMKMASVLVTKPGGLSTTEACRCCLPCVLFDAIPGSEERNAARLVEAGAGILTRGSHETAAAVLRLLRDEAQRERMAQRAARLAPAHAAQRIARLALNGSIEDFEAEKILHLTAMRDATNATPRAIGA